VEGWLENLVRPIEEGLYQYTCGPVTSRRAGVYRTMNDVEDGEVVDGPPTANVALSRSLFDAVGGFDERYAYGSDVDIAWRCAKLGSAPRNVKKAVMTMDWGAWELQKKRSWRYGRARARLARTHRAHGRILRNQPEILAYPLIGLGALAGVAGIKTRIGMSIGGASLLGLAGLGLRNRRTPKARQVMLGHFIYGWAYIVEYLFGPRRGSKQILALHTPQDDGTYVQNLVAGLNQIGVGAEILQGPTNSQTLNLLAQPLVLAWKRIRGVRILHLHWTWGHALPWAKGRVARRCLRGWFNINLGVARRLGMRIVWTAHNLYPHEPVFDDDRQARLDLVGACSAVIAHDERAAARVGAEFGVLDVQVIDQGFVEHVGSEREQARRNLGIGEETVVVLGFGKIMRYKGFETMLAAGLHLKTEAAERVQFRIVGACADDLLRGDLETLAKGVRAAGVEVVLDLQRVSGDRLGDELAAADMCVYMFTTNLNSASIRAAQRSGRIAIVGAGITHTDHRGTIMGGETSQSCAQAIEHVRQLDATEREQIEAAARAAANRTWLECAKETEDTYRAALARSRK
jgi:glycosyltransferase involved in cell wall biosynthesis